ncbi:unnamed protein product [Mytilus coruscus]|uniref:Endonuclease/exonuclease/phosphatase domain-containing protein n=1 Tax=Mytilus coruscus TaxID=42192 RepID=A0A6J8DRA0_MYTCO|nr:unnamed protein product [Mytilus coruscus]
MDKYEDMHTIVFCGDMNGTLIKERNNSHDKKLAKFIKANKLNVHQEMITKSTPTFYHNDGKSTSQIDYIFSNNDVINTAMVMQQDPINSSSHLPVIANLTKRLKTEVKKGKKSHTTYKLLWEKTDKKEYRNVLNQMIATCNWNDSDVNEKVNQLTSILHKTADKVVPKKLIKLTGFKKSLAKS